MSSDDEIILRFAGDEPTLQFVEAEDGDGESIDIGTWVPEDDFHLLKVDATRNDTLWEVIEQWREDADRMIHEGENDYVQGRGGQLAMAAYKLEKIIEDE